MRVHHKVLQDLLLFTPPWTCRHFQIPILQAFLGLLAIRKYGDVIDTRNVKLYVNTKGDADSNLLQTLPPGYKEIQCHFAASGHMMASCCEYMANTGPNQDQLSCAVKEADQKMPDTAPPSQVPEAVPAPEATPPPPSSCTLTNTGLAPALRSLEGCI